MGQVLAMRRSLRFLALLVLAGCTSDPGTARLIDLAVPFSRQEPAPSPEFIAAFQSDAPRYIAVVESNPEAIAPLVRLTLSDTSGVGTWISPDGSMLLFEDGFLVGSRGFGADVLASDITETAALVQGLTAGYATRLMTLINGEDRAITRAFKCQITPGAIDPVQIGTRTVAARTATEDCRGDVASFTNFYWVVPGSGEIIQSSQWAGQVTGKVSLRVAPVDPG